MKNIYDFKVKTINEEEISLDKYKNKTLLIVNVASKCGFTPQYKELEALYKKYKDRGLEILAFPSNQFKQETASNKEILEFCSLTYGVTFPVFSKIEVNGKNTQPLYEFLKSEKSGLLGMKNIKWNFTKFLVDKNGRVVDRFAPSSSISSFEAKIIKIL